MKIHSAQQANQQAKANRKSNAATPQDDWVAVGTIAGPFGVRGEMKVQPLTSFPERFSAGLTLYIGDARTPYTVQQAHLHKQQVLLTLDGITDIEATERLRGKTLYIPAGDIHPLEADQFYLHDIIGMRVVHINGQELGTVRDVLVTGGVDLFVVTNPQTGQETLLPAVKAFITAIDKAAGVMTVDPIPGLFDDNADTAQ